GADHALRRAAHAAERAGEVHVDHRLELLVAHAHEELVLGHAGVGDEHLDGAHVLLDGGERRVDGRGVGDVRHVGLDAFGQVSTAVDRGDAVAVRHEALRDGAADTAGCTRHDDYSTGGTCGN